MRGRRARLDRIELPGSASVIERWVGGYSVTGSSECMVMRLAEKPWAS